MLSCQFRQNKVTSRFPSLAENLEYICQGAKAVGRTNAKIRTVSFGVGPSTSATAQLLQEADYGLGDEIPGWATSEELQDQFEAEGYPVAGSSEGHHRGDGRKAVEVKVTRIPHTFKKDELHFDRNGRIQSSTEDDWAKGKRDQRTMWFYRSLVCFTRLSHTLFPSIKVYR